MYVCMCVRMYVCTYVFFLSVFYSEYKFVVSQVNSELTPLTGPDP